MKQPFFSFNVQVLTFSLLLALCLAPSYSAAQFFQQPAVGGIAIDAQGAVDAPTVEDQRRLDEIRKHALAEIPKDLEPFTKLRAVSLKQLEAAIAKALANQQPLADEVRYLAGLQRIEFVLLYPEQNDIVLAGPAEGWRIDSLGNVVGATTGRPVVMLDDLAVALRARETSRLEPISCSIDPTPEGLKRVRAVLRGMRTVGNRPPDPRPIEEAMGPQVVTVTGVPETSHFARVMVAADFRMKRLAMNFQPAPVDDMPSFMHLIKSSRRVAKNMMPRWWLATNYEPLARDAEGLAWQLRGQGVQCLAEEDYFDAEGQRQKSVKAGRMAQQWAHTLTARYDELAEQDSAFGQLRNVMDLAVVAALIDKEQLLVRSGLEIPQLLSVYSPQVYNAPKYVRAQASFIRHRGNWVVSASGGVQLLPWQVADRTEEVAEVGALREQLSAGGDQWYWQ